MTSRLKRALLCCCLVLVGCAVSNKAMVITENGLRAGEKSWDAHYRSEAERCEGLYEPKTPEMEDCFGETYDADAEVAKAIEAAVALLRAYWLARSQGKTPDWNALMSDVQAIIQDLPEPAREFFQRVQDIP